MRGQPLFFFLFFFCLRFWDEGAACGPEQSRENTYYSLVPSSEGSRCFGLEPGVVVVVMMAAGLSAKSCARLGTTTNVGKSSSSI